MKITKEDLELFCILENEINKTYTNGCIFYYKGRIYKKIHWNYVYEFDGTAPYKWIFPFFTPIRKIKELKMENLFKHNIPNNGILGHYPTTNNLIMFLLKKGCRIERQQTTGVLNIIRYGEKIFELDLTTELKNYTDGDKNVLIFNLKKLCK